MLLGGNEQIKKLIPVNNDKQILRDVGKSFSMVEDRVILHDQKIAHDGAMQEFSKIGATLLNMASRLSHIEDTMDGLHIEIQEVKELEQRLELKFAKISTEISYLKNDVNELKKEIRRGDRR